MRKCIVFGGLTIDVADITGVSIGGDSNEYWLAVSLGADVFDRSAVTFPDAEERNAGAARLMAALGISKECAITAKDMELFA